ncbi:hypothetical protein ACFXKD_27960 [Nocardiopsis aegyptia]|uniref:hypothetical protein n=1 Tax=Nocardiopsis aegyptia TaxID=220378 RepID=UPI00366E43A2
MPTVPNPDRLTDDVRMLLGVIAHALDVPLDDEPAAAGSVSRDRAIQVRVAIDAALNYSTPADVVRVLRGALAVSSE